MANGICRMCQHKYRITMATKAATIGDTNRKGYQACNDVALPSSFSFLDELEKQAKARRCENSIFSALVWGPLNRNSPNKQFLIGGSNFGRVYVWEIDCPIVGSHEQREAGQDLVNSCNIPASKSVLDFQIDSKFYKSSIFDINFSTSLTDDKTFKEAFVLHAGKSVHSVDVCDKEVVFLATAKNVSKWEWGKREGVLSCVQTYTTTVENPVFTDIKGMLNRNLLLAGTSDGQVLMWDISSARSLTSVDISTCLNENASLVSLDPGMVNQFRRKSELQASLNCLDVDKSSNWMTCCGTFHDKSRKSFGFVCMFHVLTVTLTSATIIREQPKCIRFHEGFNRIITSANNGAVTFWNKSNLHRESSTRTSMESSNCIALNEFSQHFAVSGSSCNLDCFAQMGNVSFTISLDVVG